VVGGYPSAPDRSTNAATRCGRYGRHPVVCAKWRLSDFLGRFPRLVGVQLRATGYGETDWVPENGDGTKDRALGRDSARSTGREQARALNARGLTETVDPNTDRAKRGMLAGCLGRFSTLDRRSCRLNERSPSNALRAAASDHESRLRNS
jgi:hypothetical protein